MNVLLDTHTLLWYFENNRKLPGKIISIIDSTSNDVFLSDASVFEMAIKISIGKLQLSIPFSNLPYAGCLLR
ncbi:MAG TPA: type II toxin-antitoxin system VapC family toxin [Chitinophagales bacterium]|nr:type II toxin-antitoxin system VapC family toxin [Chitinophagales bacterium]